MGCSRQAVHAKLFNALLTFIADHVLDFNAVHAFVHWAVHASCQILPDHAFLYYFPCSRPSTLMLFTPWSIFSIHAFTWSRPLLISWSRLPLITSFVHSRLFFSFSAVHASLPLSPDHVSFSLLHSRLPSFFSNHIPYSLLLHSRLPFFFLHLFTTLLYLFFIHVSLFYHMFTPFF